MGAWLSPYLAYSGFNPLWQKRDYQWQNVFKQVRYLHI
jgi:hypothetical protein